MGAAYKIRASAVVLLAVLLAACAGRPVREAPPAPTPAPQAISREGRAFAVVSRESLLTVLVYRGGPLAKAGHNHVVASHTLTGVAYAPPEVTGASFEMRVPVNELVIDEADLRTLEGPDFPPDVPESAREGTRRNLLGTALLDGEHYPEILLQSERIERTAEGAQAQVRVTVRDQVRSVTVPLHYEMTGDELRVSGEFPLKQTDLGLTPFSLLGGALRVEDGIQVRFRVVARAAEGQ